MISVDFSNLEWLFVLLFELITRSNFWFLFNFDEVTRKWKNNSLSILLITRSETFYFSASSLLLKVELFIFWLRVSNLKVIKWKFNHQISKHEVELPIFQLWVRRSKWNFLFFNFELVTRIRTFYFSTSS